VAWPVAAIRLGGHQATRAAPRGYSLSSTVAVAMPWPMHIVCKP